MYAGRMEPLLVILVLCTRVFMSRAQTDVPFTLEPTHVGQRLGGYVSATIEGVTSLAKCAVRCKRDENWCMSVNYQKATDTCELNDMNTMMGVLGTESGWTYSDISLWPKEIAGGCSVMACSSHEECMPSTTGVVCMTNDQVCGNPPASLNNATLTTNPSKKIPGAKAIYTCDTTLVDAKESNDMTLTCAGWGVWSSPLFMCMEPEA